MSWLKITAGKSGAREVGFFLLALWVFLVMWAQFIAEKDTFFERKFDSITTAVFSFALSAFGIASVMNRLSQNDPAPRVPLGQRGTAAPKREIE